jgi:hypothetical protein
LFGVADEGILSAVGCHTTLRAGASPLDKVVFVADKIAWDQAGPPPFLADLQAGLDRSRDHGARADQPAASPACQRAICSACVGKYTPGPKW